MDVRCDSFPLALVVGLLVHGCMHSLTHAPTFIYLVLQLLFPFIQSEYLNVYEVEGEIGHMCTFPLILDLKIILNTLFQAALTHVSVPEP